MKRKLILTIVRKFLAWNIVGASAAIAGLTYGWPAAAGAFVASMLVVTLIAVHKGAVYIPDAKDTCRSLAMDYLRCCPRFWLLCFSPFHFACFQCGGFRPIWMRCPKRKSAGVR